MDRGAGQALPNNATRILHAGRFGSRFCEEWLGMMACPLEAPKLFIVPYPQPIPYCRRNHVIMLKIA
jgi:hypothetical protein